MEIKPTNAEDIERSVRNMLTLIGEDVSRDGLRETPSRISRMCGELFAGYEKNNAPVLKTFPNESGNHGMVIDTGEFFSLCEHHMLPFFGTYRFAYIPGDTIIGLSKIARCVRYCSARLQVQERLASDILDMIGEALPDARGMAIRLTGEHMCKRMRGARINGMMTSMLFNGVFEADASLRNEFLNNG